MKAKRFFFAAWAAVGLIAGTACAALTEARPAPAWFDRGVVYQVQPRAFTADGKLRSAAAKLGYLKDCGVTVVYLLPVFTACQGDGGMAFLNTDRPESVTAFVRRMPGERTVLVVQNWSAREVTATVDGPGSPSSPLLEKDAERLSGDAFRLGSYGYWIGE